MLSAITPTIVPTVKGVRSLDIGMAPIQGPRGIGALAIG